MIRGKFNLDGVEQKSWGGKIFKFNAISDSSTEENKRYAKATPQGRVEITVDNPPAAEYFELGKTYYLDFTKADQ